jgi:hypothetical protein
MAGLYVSVTPDGKIKRHLSTADGELPLEDIILFDELIALADRDFWRLCAYIKEVLLKTFGFGDCVEGADYLKKAVAQYLSEQQATDPVYALLTELLIADSIRNRKNKRVVIDEIICCLRSPISVQTLIIDVLKSLCENTPIQNLQDYPGIHQLTTTAIHTLGETLTVQYCIHTYEQYYHFLLQQFIASKPNVAQCQYCGGYFIPKTKRKTLYCDRIIRDGKTCKQIAPYENHKKLAAANRVIGEFDQSMNRIRRRLERTGKDKKKSPVDLTDDHFCLWKHKAINAKKSYLAGELTEEEAMAIIYVPKKDELLEKISSELTLETAAT